MTNPVGVTHTEDQTVRDVMDELEPGGIAVGYDPPTRATDGLVIICAKDSKGTAIFVPMEVQSFIGLAAHFAELAAVLAASGNVQDG